MEICHFDQESCMPVARGGDQNTKGIKRAKQLNIRCLIVGNCMGSNFVFSMSQMYMLAVSVLFIDKAN